MVRRRTRVPRLRQFKVEAALSLRRFRAGHDDVSTVDETYKYDGVFVLRLDGESLVLESFAGTGETESVEPLPKPPPAEKTGTEEFPPP